MRKTKKYDRPTKPISKRAYSANETTKVLTALVTVYRKSL